MVLAVYVAAEYQNMEMANMGTCRLAITLGFSSMLNTATTMSHRTRNITLAVVFEVDSNDIFNTDDHFPQTKKS